MEAAPRLPMISFDLFSSPESVQFGKKLKPYIASFYNEDPESYITEISKLDALRATAVHPSPDISGIQNLKKYYCQLHFLKSRFPMDPDQPCFIEFEWKDSQNGTSSGGINFELMAILHNIGVLHTILGAQDSRSNPEGMKLACSHFQCAIWAFQTLKEKYPDCVAYITSLDVPHFYKQVCLAQAQECILEKSMLDNRKSTIISKVAVQVWDYYRQALSSLKAINEDVVGRNKYKEWMKYLQFKIAYHRCISLLFQGQQAEELQKMGERVAFYQGACDQLQEARKFLTSKQQNELADALAFTTDVVEGKRKAAKNENEFIYHEDVPDIANLQEAKGASLVKGIEFNVNDPEVSGVDIFARLVPMEAHEAASVYSEKKAEILREIGKRVEIKDQTLVEFMSSMQLDILTKMHQATGIPQELIDRAASLSAKPTAIQGLIDSMAQLSNIYHDVEANLNEIDALLKEEEENEKNYVEIMGKRPPSIITTDLAREASKYKEAHTKAKESNETLSKAMMTHLENLKILQRPIRELQQKLPSIELPDANIDQNALKELEMLNAKVDEMKTQRAMLWAQLRDAIHNDDITSALVTKQPNQSLEEVYKSQLEKHQHLIDLLDQNLSAQDNIKNAFVDCYAKAVNTRRYIQDVITKRNSTIQALITSHDSYDELLLKATKGIEFYTKLEVNVSKLLQRIKSASKVQQEEREQMLAKSVTKKDDINLPLVSTSSAIAPKLKDYLEARKKAGSMSGYSTLNYGGVSQNLSDTQNWPPSIRPAPVGSEINSDPAMRITSEAAAYYQQMHQNYGQTNDPNLTNITNRMGALMGKQDSPVSSPYNPQYSYSSYIPQNYTPTSYTYPSQHYSDIQGVQSPVSSQDISNSKASTTTTNFYQTISSYMPMNMPQANDTMTHMQYPDSSLKNAAYQQNKSSQQQQQYIQGQYLQQYQQATSTPQCPQSYVQPAGYPQQHSAGYNSLQYGSQLGAQAAVSGSGSSVASPVGVNTQAPQVTVAQVYGANSQLQAGVGAGGQYYGNQTSSVAYSQYPNQQVSTYASQQQTSTAQQTYFPQGYAPNYSNPTDVSSPNTHGIAQYQNQYYTQQHASSVAPNVSNYSNYSTYSAPTGDPYKVQAGSSSSYMSTGVPGSSTISNAGADSVRTTQAGAYNAYGSVYGYGQQNYASTLSSTSYTYPTSSSQVTTNPARPVNVVSKESNVDLLTGLDFSATSNIPTLTPQPNIAPELPKELEKKPSLVEAKPSLSSPKSAESPAQPSKKESIRVLPSKPLNNSEVKALFNQELEKYEKSVETLTSKTLSGPTTLDVKWKEIQDNQTLDAQKRIISVARCYPMKNRFPDILPYDYSRVELASTQDDYINASFVKQISPFGPQFIVTQAPLPSTFGDFWAMVREQQVELIFCLLNDNEIGDDVYWPKEKGKSLALMNQSLVISLQSMVVKPNWTERIISLNIPETKESRVVMHLQFTSWPGSLFPTTPEPFISYVLELISLFQQQKSLSHPILMHCASGIGRSGLACLLCNAILDATNQSNSIPDLAGIASQLGHFRKNIVRDREHLKFAYEAMLCYMRQLLLQDNLKKKLSEVVPAKEVDLKPNIPDVQENIIDPLSTLDPFWASKK